MNYLPNNERISKWVSRISHCRSTKQINQLFLELYKSNSVEFVPVNIYVHVSGRLRLSQHIIHTAIKILSDSDIEYHWDGAFTFWLNDIDDAISFKMQLSYA